MDTGSAREDVLRVGREGMSRRRRPNAALLTQGCFAFRRLRLWQFLIRRSLPRPILVKSKRMC